MSGTIQSSNYVPGASGWKLNFLADEFEINGSSITVGSLPSDPQPISITAGEWSECELPSNAIERYAFIGAELDKVPAECRESAEFKTEDVSFDRDGSDYRTTLTYVRQETSEEVTARAEKAKVSGTRLSIKNGLLTVTHDGAVRIKIGNLDQPKPEQPFKVDGDQVYISKAFVLDSNIYSNVAANWRVTSKPGVNGLYAAGLGLGLSSQVLVSADRFAINETSSGTSPPLSARQSFVRT